MCGFVGYVGDIDLRTLARMTSVIAHRGPDDERFWTAANDEPPVSLGFRRLVVMDPEGGQQPMSTSDGSIVLVYNGEIYNHRELRLELQDLGSRFRTNHSDTEVLLEGYRRWGTGVVTRLNGMFAFAIYDRDRKCIVLGRDRFGKKPLFYAKRGETVVFGSELTSVTKHPKIESRICMKSMSRYLAFGHVPAPDTIYEGVRKVPAGTVVTYGIGTHDFLEKRYWRYRIRPHATPDGTINDWADELRALLRVAVKRRLESDVPLGFLLSGGIDSAAVVAFSSEILNGRNAQTFTVGFEDETFDERKFANLVAKTFGTKHQTRIVGLDDARTTLPEIYRRLDEPIADGSLLPMHMVSRLASERVTVALSGDGGDELFAGYDPFTALRLAKIYQQIAPEFLRGTLQYISRALPLSEQNMSFDFKLRRALRGTNHGPGLWNPLWLAPASVEEIKNVTGMRHEPENLYQDVIALWHECESENLVDRSLEFYANYYLEGVLTKVDRASMLCGLEVRSPFLDVDLVEFALRLPPSVKLHLGTGKWLLKKALSELLPREILRRPKKGFGVPTVKWFRDLPVPTRVKTERLGLNWDVLMEYRQRQLREKSDHRGVLWAWSALDMSLT